MKTTVYISGENMLVCCGEATANHLTVQRMESLTLPPVVAAGAMEEEGSATDPRVEAIKTFWRNNQLPDKGVKLVLENSEVHTKLITVPLVKERELFQLIKNEYLTEFEQSEEEELYDYFVLNAGSKTGGGEVLAVSVSKNTVGDRFNLFKAAGIVLTNIDISLTTVIRLTRIFPALQGQTYILVLVNGSQMMLAEFIDGKYHFSNASTLYEERGTAGVAVEISRAVSNMVQFNQAEKTEAVIEKVYVCGFDQKENGFIGSMADFLELPVELLPGFDAAVTSTQNNAVIMPRDCIFAVAGLIDD